MKYPVLIDGNKETGFGVIFPDFDGLTVMGDTIEQALLDAQEALYSVTCEMDGPLPQPSPVEELEIPDDSIMSFVSLIPVSGHKTRLNVQIDKELDIWIRKSAAARQMNLGQFMEFMAKTTAHVID